MPGSQIQSGGTGGDAGGLPQLWRQDISDHEGRWIQALRLRRISQMHLRKQIRSAHFQSGAAVQQDSRPSQAEAEKAAPVQHEEQIAVPAPANPAAPAAKTNPEPRSPEAVAPKQDVEAGPLLDASGAPADRVQPQGDEIAAAETVSLPPDITELLIERTSDKYWRIPNLILPP